LAILFEGTVSLVVILALTWPFVPRHLVGERPGADRGSNRVHVHLGWYGSSLRATSNPVIG
jgi:hypothetical protein